mgnify:CR=1 FL=1
MLENKKKKMIGKCVYDATKKFKKKLRNPNGF